MESIGQEALDRVTGAVQKITGSVTGRDDLQREGDLHSRRADASREARAEDGRADVADELAEAGKHQRDASAKRARLLAEESQQQQQMEAEREGEREKQLIAEQTDRATAATEADAQRAEQRARDEQTAAARQKADGRRRAADLESDAEDDLASSGALDPQLPQDAKLSERLLYKSLIVTRLPLSAVERLTGRTEGTWPPAVAFRLLEASVMQIAGGVLRNDDLVLRGKAKQASARRVERATEKQAQAAQVEAETQARAQAKAQEAEQAQKKARHDAQVREDKLKSREMQRQEQAQKKTQAKKAAAQERAAKVEQGHRNRRRTDALVEATQEQAAATHKTAAARQEKKVVELDREIANAARTRKSS